MGQSQILCECTTTFRTAQDGYFPANSLFPPALVDALPRARDAQDDYLLAHGLLEQAGQDSAADSLKCNLINP